jgi:hypothetical protein
MRILIEAKTEKQVLASVQEEATAEEIRQALIERSENCVDSRCGCATC